jgi:hypothetical protein
MASSSNGIFVLCSARSGSTMLRKIIDGHRDICNPAELEIGQIAESLLMTLDRTVGRQVPDAEREERVRAEARRRIDDIMEQAASLRDKPLWSQKHHADAAFLNSIYTVYPDAYYVCLYRNCMDVVNSIVEQSGRGSLFPGVSEHLRNGNVVEAAIDYWIERFMRIRHFENDHPEQCFHLKYETLVFEPRETLRELFTFLGVDWYESLVTDGLRSEEEGGGAGRVSGTDHIDSSRVGTGKRISLDHIDDRHRRRMNQALEAIGYAPVEDDFNTAPSPYVPDEHRDAHEAATASPDAPLSIGEVESFLRAKVAGLPAAAPMDGSFKLVVDDLPNGTWTVDLDDRRVQQANRDAHCTIALDADTLQGIVDGSLNTSKARLDGRIRTSGDQGLVDRVGQLL